MSQSRRTPTENNSNRSQRESESSSWSSWAPVLGAAAFGLGAAVLVNKMSNSVPVAAANNGNGVPVDYTAPAPHTNVVDGVHNDFMQTSNSTCQCKTCDKCKFLTLLKVGANGGNNSRAKAHILKQIIQGLCTDVVDSTDEFGVSSFRLAMCTKDCEIIQAVMAFWPAVFRRGFHTKADADIINTDLMTSDYSYTVIHTWKMVSDLSFICLPENHTANGLPSELHFRNDPVAIVREGVPGVKGIRILAVDGGGTRGLVPLELLAHIEDMSGKPIADCFDWFFGTSTGGIILLYLALNKNRVEDCRKLYFRLKDEVFSGRKPYNSQKFEKLLKEYFPPDKLMEDIDSVRIVITATTGTYNHLDLKIFTNYDSSCSTPIWEVARMTSAAPSFFEPYEFPQGSKEFVYDGGLMANNPTQDVCYELKGHASLENSTIVSLGTGRFYSGEQVSININDSVMGTIRMAWSGDLKKLVDLLSNQVSKTDGEKVQNMVTLATAAKCFYVRLTPTLPHKLELDETDNGKLVNAVWHTKAFALINYSIFEEVVARL